MTLPRELKLSEYDGQPILCSTVVKEIDQIAGQWQKADGAFNAKDAYQLQLTLGLDKNSTVTLSMAMASGSLSMSMPPLARSLRTARRLRARWASTAPSLCLR